jgi:hypothetical protein
LSIAKGDLIAMKTARRGARIGPDIKRRQAEYVLGQLRVLAVIIPPRDFPQLARKIRSAIKSADGARRHAERMHAQEQRHVASTR